VMLASDPVAAVLAGASERARTAGASGTLVLLIEPIHAAWLFSAVGRPDRGRQLPDDHLYCDWLLDRDALLRILQVDYVELSAWRAALVAELEGNPSVHLATPAGTDLALEFGAWQALDGEACAPLLPGSARGRLVLDGALYDAALPRPIVLQVRSGAIVDLDGLLRGGPRKCMLHDDLSRDAGACLLGELGLGVNPCADRLGQIMEAEMARGTAHVGLGDNHFLGGSISSAIHIDAGLLRPTVHVGSRLLCLEGSYRLP